MHNCIVCTCVASLYCGWVCDFSGFQLDQKNLHILHICVLSPECGVGDHVQPQWSCFTKCLPTFWASVSFHSTVGEQWACAFSDVQLDQMTCCIGQNRMVFLCCGLACGSSDVLLDQMSSCKLNNCVSFLLCGWACAFSYVELYQMTYCIDTSMSFFFAVGYRAIFQSSCTTE